MTTIGAVQGAGNGYDDPGWARVTVVDGEIELAIEGRDGGPTVRMFLAFDPGPNSVVALARLLLEAEHQVGELYLEALGARTAKDVSVTSGE